MAGPTVAVSGVPTGGAAMLNLPDYLQPPSGVTQMMVARAVSGSTGLSAWTTLYSGGVMPYYLDVGDSLPAPLASGKAYVWQVTDSRGTTQAGPIVPASSMTTVPDSLTQIFIRLLQGALNSTTLPPGVQATQVTTRMPQGGWQALPFIVVNLDLIQQTEVQIGEDVPNPDENNDWTLWVNAKRLWRVSVFSQDAEERDFYRDTLLSVFRVLKASVFSLIGLNVTHSFQATSGTDANEWDGHTPGFYFADLMLEIDGRFDTAVLTNYGLINQILVNATVEGAGEAP